VNVTINIETGSIEITVDKNIVEVVENPQTEIALSDL
jgi:hypothetical protein